MNIKKLLRQNTASLLLIGGIGATTSAGIVAYKNQTLPENKAAELLLAASEVSSLLGIAGAIGNIRNGSKDQTLTF